MADTPTIDGFMFALLMLALLTLYVAVAAGDKKRVEIAGMAVIAAVLLAFLVWFVLCMPAPDYMPEAGSDPQQIPYQMKD